MINTAEDSTVIDIQKLDDLVEVKPSNCNIRRFLCWFMIIGIFMTSIGFNIYLGIEHFQTKGLAVERKI